MFKKDPVLRGTWGSMKADYVKSDISSKMEKSFARRVK